MPGPFRPWNPQVPVQLAARVRRVKPSPTVALTGRVAKLKAEGKDIIGLGVGEPDFDTPQHIADAGIGAISNGFTRYTAVDGIPELKDAIIAKFKRDNGLDYTRQADPGLLRRQAEFLQPVHGGDQPRRRGHHPRAVLGVVSGHGVARRGRAGHARTPASNRATRSRAAQLEARSRRKRAWSMINSPSNPTGAVYTRAELEGAGRGAAQASRASSSPPTTCTSTSCWADEPFANFLNACPDLYRRAP